MKYILYFLLAVIFYSCAIRVNPEGGVKDSKPPKILESDPPNHSVLIRPSDIKLSFDEFIALKDLNTQLVSSPLLKYPPLTKIRKRNLYIHLADTLADNTTYTLNFGNSITDNNEGNVMEDYQYVFSTGEIIDSLRIKGHIQYAFDHKTEKDILALIYRNDSDSIPYLKRPLYVGKTNADGDFTIKNIAPGNYKIVALKETDGNYLYSGSGESFAFIDTLVSAGSENISLSLFDENPVPHFSKSVSEFAGKEILIFTGPADTVHLHWLSDTSAMKIQSFNFSSAKDSLTLWYKNQESDSVSFCYWNGKTNDTIVSRLFKNDTDKKKEKFHLDITSPDPASRMQNYFEPFSLVSNHPLVKTDSTFFILKEDSLPVRNFTLNFSDTLHLHINFDFPWKQKTKYSLMILPGGAKDIYGLKNDTAQIEFTVRQETDYGTLKVKFTAPRGKYIMQLVTSTESVVGESYLTGDSIVSYKNLLPNSYRVKIIYDDNNNHRWDTGNYLKHIQPEKTAYYPSTITVRSNWDVDVKWNESDVLPVIKK